MSVQELGQYENEELVDIIDEDEESEPTANQKIIDSVKGVAETSEAVADAAQKVSTISSKISAVGGKIGALLGNPVTWIVLLTIIALVYIYSATKVIGKSDYNIQCMPNGSSTVNVSIEADDRTRQNAIASWLTTTPFDGLGGQSMSKEQASGVIGNFIQESAGARPHYVQTLSMGNPDYYKSVSNEDILTWGSVGGKAIGIAQWDSGRRIGLVNYAIANRGNWYDLSIQLNFLKTELDGSEGDRLARGGFAEKTHTVEEYAVLWNRLFERSAGDDNSPHVIKRKEHARLFFSEYEGGGAFISNCSGGSIDTSNLVQLAIQVSYPFGDPAARYNCTPGDGNCGQTFSKPEYIQAKLIAQERGGADPMPGLLASCDRFVATILKATGTDEGFPWGAVTHQRIYMEGSPNWERVSCQARQPGDVIVEPNKHIMLYVGIVDGKDSIASASSMERTASIMSVACNGDGYIADSYQNAEGWRKVR